MAEVKVYDSKDLSPSVFEELQNLQFEAFRGMFERLGIEKDPEDIRYLVQLDDPYRFYLSHLDPTAEVGVRFNANQIYTHPRTAIAEVNGKLAGFGSSAHNASGGGSPEGPHDDSLEARAIRRAKLLSIAKNYLWLREVAVGPEYQQQGVGVQICRALLKDAIPLQPVSAYLYPTETPFLPKILTRLGFTQTSKKEVPLYGESKPKVEQLRLQAPSARSALKRSGRKTYSFHTS